MNPRCNLVSQWTQLGWAVAPVPEHRRWGLDGALCMNPFKFTCTLFSNTRARKSKQVGLIQYNITYDRALTWCAWGTWLRCARAYGCGHHLSRCVSVPLRSPPFRACGRAGRGNFEACRWELYRLNLFTCVWCFIGAYMLEHVVSDWTTLLMSVNVVEWCLTIQRNDH